jgi:hypothetical protein
VRPRHPRPVDAMRRWQAILAEDARPPAGTSAATLLPELGAYLASPDLARHDAIAIDVLDAWILLMRPFTEPEWKPRVSRPAGAV